MRYLRAGKEGQFRCWPALGLRPHRRQRRESRSHRSCWSINPHTMTLDIARSRRPLFLQQRFWPMWTALSLGAFTDNMLRQALLIGIPFGAIKISGLPNADDAIPIIGLFFPLAMLMFSTISGQIAEKYETASLFRRTKLAEVVLMAIAAIGFYLNSGLLLIITLFAMGAQSAFFSPARLAAMPKYLRPNELVRGNGLCNAGLYVSILVGLFLGGLLIAMPNGGAKISVILLVASLAGWLAIRNAPHGAPNSPTCVSIGIHFSRARASFPTPSARPASYGLCSAPRSSSTRRRSSPCSFRSTSSRRFRPMN